MAQRAGLGVTPTFPPALYYPFPPPFLRPKNLGPFQLDPVMSRAMRATKPVQFNLIVA
jgi:hypothetical protein